MVGTTTKSENNVNGSASAAGLHSIESVNGPLRAQEQGNTPTLRDLIASAESDAGKYANGRAAVRGDGPDSAQVKLSRSLAWSMRTVVKPETEVIGA